MDITPMKVKVSDLVADFKDDIDTGCYAYGGLLNVRPPYQREFKYEGEKLYEVIRTVIKGFPLGIFYWTANDDGTYGCLDGQQRTISICRYIKGAFSLDEKLFSNQPKDIQERIRNYELLVYVCRGTESERLEWFKVINIAGEELTEQELRNATYTGPWLEDAKRYFSKDNCIAFKIGNAYMKGTPRDQNYLEAVLKWISNRDGISIEEYMGLHQHDPDASELKEYYAAIIGWIEATFKKKRSQMKGLNWGYLYDTYHERQVDPDTLEEKISKLMADSDVTSQTGIYDYVFSGDERKLSIRAFDKNTITSVYERQHGICPCCKNDGIDKQWDIKEMEADHIIPWSKGGRTIEENCQMLCRKHNRMKSNL